MQSDEVVWSIINHGHCSFKAKMLTQNFCRNEHNVTGLCNRSSCPLANSRYATIREANGKLYLYIKTVERAHTPKHMWQKLRLSRNYLKALGQVDSHLAHWPKFLIHKNKQRLTKITQYLIRMRKLALKPRTQVVTEPARLKKREKRRESKAMKAAQLDTAIEKELLQRLQSGTYGDIYNFPSTNFNTVLDKETVPDGDEMEKEGVEEDEEEAEYEDETDEDIEYVEDLDESEDDMEDITASWGYGEGSEDEQDDEDGSDGEDDDADDDEEADEKPAKRKPSSAVRASASKKRPRRELELEHETHREKQQHTA